MTKHRWILPALIASCTAGAVLAGEAERGDRALSTIQAVLAGDGETATAHFSDTMKSALPAARIADVVNALRQQLGEPGERGPQRHGCESDLHAVWQRVAFERAELDAKLVFDDDDRIAGLFFVPPQAETPCRTAQDDDHAESASTPPADRRERAVTVGSEDWPLPGILTIPDGTGPFPAVVLVHGSGPHDADETVFGNKPFRDLAQGFADRGVASLRYVKRSKEHAQRMLAETPTFGIDDEVTDDAVAGISWLNGQNGIDGTQVFVLGHSLGALLAPRVCQRSDTCAGSILLAGSTRPIEDIVVAQVRYLAPHQGISDEQIAQIEAQAERVRRMRRGQEVDGPLLLGLPAEYWRSLGDYDPIATARALDRPMLILQGERDYQVTMVDFAGWRDGLSGRPEATLKSYPALDHLFMAGSGPSLPGDYMQPRHVDAQVIDDIAAWMNARASDSRPEPST